MERFADFMVKDVKTGECFRADHLIEGKWCVWWLPVTNAHLFYCYHHCPVLYTFSGVNVSKNDTSYSCASASIVSSPTWSICDITVFCCYLAGAQYALFQCGISSFDVLFVKAFELTYSVVTDSESATESADSSESVRVRIRESFAAVSDGFGSSVCQSIFT